jgi:hypothetical protein
MSARKFSIGIGLVVFLALAQAAQAADSLYLLAGTSWNQGMSPFGDPVRLYAVSPGHKLSLVRTIAPSLFAVQDDMHGKLFVEYPMYQTTTVSVIHEEWPQVKDEVVFNPKHLFVIDSEVSLAAGGDDRTYALLPVNKPSQSLGSEHLVTVLAGGPNTPAKVVPGTLALYRSMRVSGCPGGPAPCDVGPIGWILGHNFAMRVGGRQVPVIRLPQALARQDGGDWAGAINSSARFFVLGIPHGNSDRFAPTVRYAHDRVAETWKRMVFPCSFPLTRIFGEWLATKVENWSPKGIKGNDNPGREDERDWGTPLLPNVHEEYALLQGMDYSIPGILTLNNLVDGRKITLKTHEEDSEILDVSKNGLVLYRVNDEIFSTHIEGDKLSAPKLVVKGDDVPEVHWVFWSNAKVSPPPAAKPTR